MKKETITKAIKALEGARTRLSNKKVWTTNYFALDAEGNGISSRSKKAVQFCAYGAIEAETKSNEVVDTAVYFFTEAHGYGPVYFNDFIAKTNKDVSKAITQAINVGKKYLKK